MNENIKYRAWHKGKMISWGILLTETVSDWFNKGYELMSFSGIKDRKGVEIFEGDILEFSDKWEWYRCKYGVSMKFASPERFEQLKKEYEAEPMERRVIKIPEDYEWLLSREIQTYWEVVGNIYENNNLK